MDSTGVRRNGTDTDGGQHWGTEETKRTLTVDSTKVRKNRTEQTLTVGSTEARGSGTADTDGGQH